jgi:hypothetical protein
LQIIEFKSWHSRLAALQMLQNFGIFNLFLVNEEMKAAVKQIVLDSLVDEQLEVRVAASLALTGFIHSNFINADQPLIVKIIKFSIIKLISVRYEYFYVLNHRIT